MSHQHTTDRPTVGVLGLGNLGAGIAARLVESGFDVAGADREPKREGAFASHGARIGVTEVVRANILCVVTPDERGLIELLDGQAVAPAAGTSQVVVLCSTVRPDAAVELGARLAERGRLLVEAPVSGGADAARRGELSMMVGGDDAAVTAAEPVLSALANRRFAFATAGAASAVKLANQIALYASLAGLIEARALTRTFGVGDDALVQVLHESTGDSWAARNMPFFVDLVRQYDDAVVPGAHRPWRKDLGEFVSAAAEVKTPHRFAAALAASFGDDLEESLHTDGGAP